MNQIKKIERLAKIKFEPVGMPQIGDIMKASARDIETGFNKVSDAILPHFNDVVKHILS